jgi:hypothetical protein
LQTPETALTKLSYVIGKDDWNLEIKKQMMQNNLRGELSNEKGPEIQDYDLVDAVARFFNSLISLIYSKKTNLKFSDHSTFHLQKSLNS